MNENWQQKVEKYCDKYNIPLLYLAEILYESAVVPMVRGKAFEYSVLEVLQTILPRNEWKVSKANIGDETNFHDTDTKVLHKRTGKMLRAECKLALKEGYRLLPDGHSEIRVKCMRSRTLGSAKVKELSPKLGIEEEVLSIHNDQYLPADFDVVVTSIGNTFYRTDEKTGLFEWTPTKHEEEFLLKLKPSRTESLKDFAFRRIYLARAEDLAAKTGTGVVCSRRKCKNKSACGFIPDYPIIRFDANTAKPTNGWVPIEECSSLFKSFIKS